MSILVKLDSDNESVLNLAHSPLCHSSSPHHLHRSSPHHPGKPTRKMKVLALIALIGVLFPISTLSLSCYTCTSAQEKKCKEGKLDDKYVTPCGLTNSVNPETRLPLNATEIAALENNKQLPVLGCMKAQGTAGGEDGTIKMCMISPYLDRKDACTSETSEGASGTLCVCHSDKCNGADNIASRFNIIVALAVAICLAAVK